MPKFSDNAQHQQLSHQPLIDKLIHQGGPQPEDFNALNALLYQYHVYEQAQQLHKDCKAELFASLGEAMSLSTIQGFVYNKPHGYAGDFEVIDRIYNHHIAQPKHLSKWDTFFHNQHAPNAVRNRKAYFHELLNGLQNIKGFPTVMKIGIGPGRSMYEWLNQNPDSNMIFDCIDIDAKAIAYAKELNQNFLDQITFIHKNCLRYRPSGQYDLIWSAGVFDYFDDKVFKKMLERLIPSVAKGGQIVIGNFSDNNPSRPYMEFIGEWYLHHRSPQHLIRLAEECGVKREHIFIGCEPLGVNLFMHIAIN